MGCHPEEARQADWPTQATIVGKAHALESVLLRLERMQGTPLARLAANLRERTLECTDLSLTWAPESPESLPWSAACIAEDSAPAWVSALAGAGDLALVVPVSGELRLAGRAEIAPSGTVRFEGQWVELRPGAAEESWLVPHRTEPGPPRLADTSALLHVRFRPAAPIEVADLIPAGSQADEMFRLKSRVFSSAVLGGPLELVAYLPSEAEPLPPLAVALDVRSQTAARSAMQHFVDTLEQRWPIQSREIEVSGISGECLVELRLIPGLNPCYVVTDEALVLGSSEAVLHAALDPRPTPRLPTAGGFQLRLARFPEADQRLSRAASASAPAASFRYPWDALFGSIEWRNDRAIIHLALVDGDER